ncbi:hypothetical protein [Treponema zioleckii]|uniref:hypothetical protein n=1 Tax=Treponema zioleckii TaxID=331680 RepID=UPI00168AC88E|nr:hypothetical protein [Treponema zioleckii]
MKNTFFVFTAILSIFLISSCQTTSKITKQEIESNFVLDFGEYKLNECSNLTLVQIMSNPIGAYEETTGLRMTFKDGNDCYEGQSLRGMPISAIKKLMGDNKFSAYWAFLGAVAKLKKQGIDNRLFKFTFKDGDYFILDMKGEMQDLDMQNPHSDTEEMVHIQLLQPITFTIKK